MEELTRDNYESWFIDYLDGQLDEGQTILLNAFLERNPDLREELNGLSGMTLETGEVTFEGREQLLKTAADIPGITPDDRLCIARMEGDLTEEEAARFDTRLVEDTRLGASFAAFLKTRLVPAAGIRYPGKRMLEHRTIRLTPWLVTAISSAAVVVLVLLLWPRQQENTGLANRAAEPAGKTVPAVTGQPSATTPALLADNARPAGNNSTGKQGHKQGNPSGSGTSSTDKNPVARENAPMQPLTGKAFLSGTRIPEPQSTRLLYASAHTPVLKSLPRTDQQLSVPQVALKLFRAKVLGEEVATVKKTRFSLWEVVGAGVKGINNLAGTDMKLNREYDKKGDLLAVSFNSRLFEVESPVRGQSAR